MSIGDVLSDAASNIKQDIYGAYYDRLCIMPNVLRARVVVALELLNAVREQVDRYEVDASTSTGPMQPTRFYVEVDPSKYPDGGAEVRTYLTQHTRSVALD